MHSLKQRLKSNIRDEETASPKELLSSMQSNTCSEYELSDLSPSGYVFDADGEDEANSIQKQVTKSLDYTPLNTLNSEGEYSKAKKYVASTLRNLAKKSHNQSTPFQQLREISGLPSKPSDDQSSKLLFQNVNVLEQLVKKQKTAAIVQNFARKVRRSNIYSPPVEFSKFNEESSGSIFDLQGFTLNPKLETLLNLLLVLQITCLSVVYTLSLVFPDVEHSSFVGSLQLASTILYCLEMVVEFLTIKISAGRKLTLFAEIWEYYRVNGFWIDLANFLCLILDIALDNGYTKYMRLLVVVKIPQCLGRVQKLQQTFINNFYNEQYWCLAKVFLFNFTFAHILAIFLSAMPALNSSSNWMLVKGISHSPWFEKYIWSYYWGTTIMLTVGFGDLVATNYVQALCLIFIQTFSCIALAYNVNCVGVLISNIRAQDVQKQKKFKIFSNICNSNYISEELTWKIHNFIQESSNLKKKFNQDEQQLFVAKLPITLQKTYLKEANKKIVENLVFFKSLMERTLYNFAENIERRISHPEEIVRHIDDNYNLIILKRGELGYICKKGQSRFNERVADSIAVPENGQPFLTSLDFITKQRPNYEIKSLEYSIIYYLDYDQFIRVLKETDMDFELYALLRDKIKNIPDEFEVHTCQYCKQGHFKFTCPKLHYVPYKQHVVYRHLYLQKKNKMERRAHARSQKNLMDPIDFYRKIKAQQTKDAGKWTRSRKQILQIKEASIDFRSELIEPTGWNAAPLGCADNQYYKLTKEIIISEFSKMSKAREFEDEIWLVSIDRMMDYSGYFAQDNSHNLDKKYSVETRKARQGEKTGAWVNCHQIPE